MMKKLALSAVFYFLVSCDSSISEIETEVDREPSPQHVDNVYVNRYKGPDGSYIYRILIQISIEESICVPELAIGGTLDSYGAFIEVVDDDGERYPFYEISSYEMENINSVYLGAGDNINMSFRSAYFASRVSIHVPYMYCEYAEKIEWSSADFEGDFLDVPSVQVYSSGP